MTFYFNSTNTTWDDAENSCQTNGGHIAAYTSLEEQTDVEQYYEEKGYILKVAHCCCCCWGWGC